LQQRPRPKAGAGGALLVPSDVDLLLEKESEINAWLLQFVEEHGMQNLFQQPADERNALRQDIALSTEQVKGLVKTAVVDYRAIDQHALTLAEHLSAAQDAAVDATANSRKSSTRIDKLRANLEAELEKAKGPLCALLEREYKAAYGESARAGHAETILSSQQRLRDGYAEHVEVDLVSALLPPVPSGPPPSRGATPSGDEARPRRQPPPIVVALEGRHAERHRQTHDRDETHCQDHHLDERRAIERMAHASELLRGGAAPAGSTAASRVSARATCVIRTSEIRSPPRARRFPLARHRHSTAGPRTARREPRGVCNDY